MYFTKRGQRVVLKEVPKLGHPGFKSTTQSLNGVSPVNEFGLNTKAMQELSILRMVKGLHPWNILGASVFIPLLPGLCYQQLAGKAKSCKIHREPLAYKTPLNSNGSSAAAKLCLSTASFEALLESVGSCIWSNSSFTLAIQSFNRWWKLAYSVGGGNVPWNKNCDATLINNKMLAHTGSTLSMYDTYLRRNHS